MATPKFLRNPKTGARFRYNAHLAKRKPNLVPCNGEKDDPVFETVDVDVNLHEPVSTDADIAGVGTGDGTPPELDDPQGDDGQAGLQLDGAGNNTPAEPELVMIGEVALAEATKDQLEEFAKAAFGVELDKRKKVDTLRSEVAALLAEQE